MYSVEQGEHLEVPLGWSYPALVPKNKMMVMMATITMMIMRKTTMITVMTMMMMRILTMRKRKRLISPIKETFKEGGKQYKLENNLETQLLSRT